MEAIPEPPAVERPADALTRVLGLPPRRPWTDSDEQDFQADMDRADRELAGLIAARTPHAA